MDESVLVLVVVVVVAGGGGGGSSGSSGSSSGSSSGGGRCLNSGYFLQRYMDADTFPLFFADYMGHRKRIPLALSRVEGFNFGKADAIYTAVLVDLDHLDSKTLT